jgi:hypothetical protein
MKASVRQHARERGALDGADAQALEGALAQAERDLANAAAISQARYETAEAAVARAEAAEDRVKHELGKRDRACVRAYEAEAEAAQWESAHDRALDDVASLRAEVERLTKMLDVCSAVHGHNVKLRAEVERLTAELRLADGINGRALKRLAAANADVERLRDALATAGIVEEAYRVHVRVRPDSPQTATTLEQLPDVLDCLAAQPATAPTVLHSRPDSDVFVPDEPEPWGRP